jgi:GNAT superfamily N-acetyltransferase
MGPDLDRLFAASEATWPPAEARRVGPWMIRTGLGGGSRASAATAAGPVTKGDLALAETAMRNLGQSCLFMLRGEDDPLDPLLAAAGYEIKDPVTIYSADLTTFAPDRPPPAFTFEVWPPLAAQVEIWAEGGIGASRLAVMERVRGPKTTILGREGDAPAGTLFAAIHDGICLTHAIETAERYRRKGVARRMITAAAFWARAWGAGTLALLVTRANLPANRLYASMGMQAVGQYHYRIKPD